MQQNATERRCPRRPRCERGIPLVIDGKMIGALEASGVTPSAQDGQIAKAGAESLK